MTVTERYFHDSIYEDTPEYAVFGPDTWGLVDEGQGGVIAYFHKNNAPMFYHLTETETAR